jgi:hypothetical protein
VRAGHAPFIPADRLPAVSDTESMRIIDFQRLPLILQCWVRLSDKSIISHMKAQAAGMLKMQLSAGIKVRLPYWEIDGASVFPLFPALPTDIRMT